MKNLLVFCAIAVVCFGIAVISSSESSAQKSKSQIVYTQRGEDGSEIWIMNADGSGSRRVGPGSSPCWSPDGSKIAFTMTVDDNTDIYYMDSADGGNVTRLTTDPARDHGPTWSPDGSMILTQNTPHNRVNNFISWSPNGLWIAFEADRDRDDPEIYLANAVDGTNQQRLTYTRALDEVPAWSPDSKQIVFSSDMHGEPQSGVYDIYIMNVDGSNQKRLTFTPRAASLPSMSADGKHIVYTYSAAEGEPTHIWIMNADGSDQRVLLERASSPRYSPF